MTSIFNLFLIALICVQLKEIAGNKFNPINYALLDELVSKYNDEDQMKSILNDPPYFEPAVQSFAQLNSPRVTKSFDGLMSDLPELNSDVDQVNVIPNNELDENENRIVSAPELSYNSPSNANQNPFLSHGIRDEEFLEHSSLWRHQMMQGGAGEGFQRLKPDGSVSNVQVVKSDSMLPAYCTPPNPCPPGYTEEDGCISNFRNTASFSRQFQAMQDCMCDSEHMFNCDSGNSQTAAGQASSTNELGDEAGNGSGNDGTVSTAAEEDRELNAIARSLANQPMDSEVADQLIDTLLDHKVVAKKFSVPKPMSPFLRGERLPIVAKKSPGMA